MEICTFWKWGGRLGDGNIIRLQNCFSEIYCVYVYLKDGMNRQHSKEYL